MPFLFALIIIIVVAVTVLRSPRGRGWLGELRVKLLLGKTVPGKKYVINNLVLKIDENKTSQIDHVFINSGGIFVIETKNYSGRIYGNESRLEWTQVLSYGKVKNKLYNPIKQNQTHIYHISNVLTEKLPIISAVVFVQGNTQYIRAEGVYNLYGLKRILKSRVGVLTAEEMERAFSEISCANDTSVSNRQHVRNIQAMQADIASNICPRCGKSLVLRDGKKGSFYGCSGYPHCKFTKTK